jgi:hypothetical protein
MTLRPWALRSPILSSLSNSSTSSATIGQMLLPGMEAYARVLNPVRSPDSRVRFWNDVSPKNVNSTTQWADLATEISIDLLETGEPETGGLDPMVAMRLAQVLRSHTATPEDCFFLVWEGYAGLLPVVRSAATIQIAPHARRMHILKGQVEDATESIQSLPTLRLPMWWIPQDGAWCVGNDIYGRSVFVGASAETIFAIVNDPQLEAYLADESQPIVAEDF